MISFADAPASASLRAPPLRRPQQAMLRQARSIAPLPEITSQRLGRARCALRRVQVSQMLGQPRGVDGGAQLVSVSGMKASVCSRSRILPRRCCGLISVTAARRDVVSSASSKQSRCWVPGDQCARCAISASVQVWNPRPCRPGCPATLSRRWLATRRTTSLLAGRWRTLRQPLRAVGGSGGRQWCGGGWLVVGGGVYSVLAAENEPVRIGVCRIEIELGVASVALANVVIGGL
jgi:hypothetical protein